MSIRKIGVIAGSPSDAEMGAVYFKGRGLEVECGSVAEDAAGAVEFSAKDEGYKEEVMSGVIGRLKDEGCEALCSLMTSLTYILHLNWSRKMKRHAMYVWIQTPLTA